MTVARKLIAGFLWANAVLVLLISDGLLEALILAAIGAAVWPWRRPSVPPSV